ncbi:MAG: (Fe-S)-binding protein [Pyrobaculum sp.]
MRLDEVYKCVHCGFCLPTCPTYLATGVEGHSPRGRLHIMRAVAEGRAKPTKELLKYLDACVYCRRCETACPSGVKYGEVYEEFFRAHREAMQSVTYRRYLPLLRLLNSGPGLRLLPAAARLVDVLKPFNSGIDAGRYVGMEFSAKGGRRGRVALFVAEDCVSWKWRGDLVEAAVRVLTWNGYDVVVPRFSCCGAPYRHGGQFEKAEELARRNLEVLKNLGGVDAVVVPNSGGCQAELMRYAGGVVDVLQLLYKDGVRGELGPVQMRVAVQHSCHLMNVAKAHQAVVEVLSKIPGLKLVPLPSADVCCGGGNLYPLRHRKIAEAVLDKKRREVEEIKPDAVLVESPACLQQLGKLRIPLVFPLTLLDMSYRNGKNPGYQSLAK